MFEIKNVCINKLCTYVGTCKCTSYVYVHCGVGTYKSKVIHRISFVEIYNLCFKCQCVQHIENTLSPRMIEVKYVWFVFEIEKKY